jgi:hypothetical protein
MAPVLMSISVGLMLGGCVLLLVGAVVAAASRKTGISLSVVFWAGSDAAVHPERYVEAGRVTLVRWINALGVSLFLAGVLLLVSHSISENW